MFVSATKSNVIEVFNFEYFLVSEKRRWNISWNLGSNKWNEKRLRLAGNIIFNNEIRCKVSSNSLSNKNIFLKN